MYLGSRSNVQHNLLSGLSPSIFLNETKAQIQRLQSRRDSLSFCRHDILGLGPHFLFCPLLLGLPILLFKHLLPHSHVVDVTLPNPSILHLPNSSESPCRAAKRSDRAHHGWGRIVSSGPGRAALLPVTCLPVVGAACTR
ncbi:hypothetical protein HBI56_224010 [Parastagonospora nodorum]|uniref:Uncharacterized protein n=1 Tax=Phaeosphaeria nodorum (strain SN15 / ATCC MYA-4574 / FGSC 10173) TaxID=321614 RepID=A0A7U2EY32_PHANO|nr:hypothetical protein HBH51_024380 [Parastagonospora nodorum]QRC93993.1 hypothetical protein JI435_404940 [Parastagonospora nodorum SN15]KAH4003497.1 hypothetical protein HBI10_063550 [Parastagonospora nodorum]KAH4078022.1 hypothetical protein HBH46_239080 [Parastagonospora nodorum]KAH4128856.1 hypothetical protein HBH47_036880 [Parastagonospora nodorum]